MTRIIFVLFIISSFCIPQISYSATRDEMLGLHDDIQAKQYQIEELADKIKEYEDTVRQKQREKLSLGNQLSIVENRMEKTVLDIQSAELKIETTELELQEIDAQIQEKQEKIVRQKEYLSEFIRQIQKEDQKETLEVLLLHDSFSDFFDHLKYLEEVNGDLAETLGGVKQLKEELESQKSETETKKQALENMRESLEGKKLSLDEQKISKTWLRNQAVATEEKFRALVYELRIEQQKIDEELRALEASLRRQLEESDSDFIGNNGELVLSWPLKPTRGLSVGWHDPTYPFHYVYPNGHPAIDIRAYQRTPIRAAAPGYVAKVRLSGTKYGYMMIVHRAGFSTVYGHINSAVVQAGDYVERGQLIAYSGGAPGTTGAGRLSTGPHLHFEVWLNGMDVNPMNYLF
ncbi:MAG: peptidoglycan DD-metalloendopeptidase family protein, partial [Patescibacteria group bacterium]|nr:peptidoglycan DD-metalloendopeptidase family protein [Patescibacteria group bacterium]